ncbi:MAG TPA: adenylate/guanylate cyclase domain-containing protein [Nocardioides sp.]|nr:adenylate/guanylate cyclase domain-containing protein [Nocardioides sp.]
MVSGADFRAWCVLGSWRAATPDEVDLRGQRLVAVSSWAAALVALGFAVVGYGFSGSVHVSTVSLVTAVLFALVPQLGRFGTLVPAIGFVLVATAMLCTLTAVLGTNTGLLFYFFIMVAATPMVAGIRRWKLSVVVLAVSTACVATLEFTVAADTGAEPHWLMTGAFVANSIAAAVMAAGIVGYGLLQIQRVEAALVEEHRRSEALLDNILPRDIADRLKQPERTEIADAYNDASVLFADIAGFTAMSSDASPAEVVRFLDRLYTELDSLIELHGLEKIKTTGDSYMVVSGVPQARVDHAQALARFALEMRAISGTITGTHGRALALRIGMASGPVVAGVIGSKKFFYDVWGDAVNMASRMESTGVAGRIQVSQSVHDALAWEFSFEERGEVAVKGKGDQRTWFLTGAASNEMVGHRAGM